MEIRKMLVGDYEAVYALWTSCSGMGLNDLDDSREGIAKFLTKNPDTCFVAIEQGGVVGVILAGHDGRRGYIYHTSVHPDYRKRGIATKLVNTAMEALEGCGINKVALVVFARNQGGKFVLGKDGIHDQGRLDLQKQNDQGDAPNRHVDDRVDESSVLRLGV